MSGTAPLVVVTRDPRDEDGLTAALSERGARVWALPTIRITPPADLHPLADALAAVNAFDWVLFTSGHAVAAACGHPAWNERWHTRSRRPLVGAVGHATAARLAAYGVAADLVADRATGEGLAAALAARVGDLTRLRVLWPRSDIAGRAMYDRLVAAGASVADPEAYRTERVRPEALDEFVSELSAGRIAAVAFLSPSSAQGLAASLPAGTLRQLAGRALVAAIGPTTAAALVELEATPDIMPAAASAAALADAIVRRLSRAGVTS